MVIIYLILNNITHKCCTLHFIKNTKKISKTLKYDSIRALSELFCVFIIFNGTSNDVAKYLSSNKKILFVIKRFYLNAREKLQKSAL